MNLAPGQQRRSDRVGTGSGRCPDAGAPRSVRTSRGHRWVAMIFGLIGLNMTIVGFTLYFALTDKSSAIEPDYYARALKYDEVIQQRAASAALGWKATASLRPSPSGTSVELVVNLVDREGHAVERADVTATAFASVRAGERQTLTLREDREAPTIEVGATPRAVAGTYAAPMRLSAPGVWRVDVTAKRGRDTFAQQTDLFVPGGAS